MLEDFSQHILDIAENSVNAGATTIRITLEERTKDGWLRLLVVDDGCGMDEDTVRSVFDPFYTTRTTRRVGLGLPFLRQAAEACGGDMSLQSERGRGTTLGATFRLDNIDLPPLGNIPSTLVALLTGHPRIRWIYRHSVEEREFVLDSRELVDVIEDPELFRTARVAEWVRGYVSDNLREIGSGGVGIAEDQES